MTVVDAFNDADIKPPSIALALVEGQRALAELATLPIISPLLRFAPSGDGHPVMVLPGFMAGGNTTVPLRRFLKSKNYTPFCWELGRNLGPRAIGPSGELLATRLQAIHRKMKRKVSLVGWSLGGVFALYAAHQVPECVRCVVTLGSPVNVDPAGSASPPLVKAMYRLIAHPIGPAAHAMQPRARKLRETKSLPMPLSCLYSLSDGVVPPQEATVDGNPALHQNIRVPGSHVGLGFNAVVLWIVAERLSQPEGQWHRFAPTGALGRAYRMLTQRAAPA